MNDNRFRAITKPEIEICATAQGHEMCKNLELRNALALRLFNRKGARCVIIREGEPDEVRIETWWDRYSKNFVTQTLDRDSCELQSPRGGFVESVYTGNKHDAAVAHLWAINRELFKA